jgi:hypothetical protein
LNSHYSDRLLEIMHSFGSVLTWGLWKFSLISYVGYLDIASWLAFVVFAAAAFKQFSFRWLRVIAALFISYFLPVGILLLPYAKFNYLIPLDWLFTSVSIVVAAGQLLRLAIAGFIYVWSVRHERGSIGAIGTNPAARAKSGHCQNKLGHCGRKPGPAAL